MKVCLFFRIFERNSKGKVTVIKFTLLFLLDGSLTLERGQLFEIIPVWPKLWKISFKIKPSKETLQQRSNIFQFTTGEFCCEHGFAIPGVWMEANTRNLYISTSINDNGNQVFVTNGRFIKIPSDRFSEVIIQQVEGSNDWYFKL